MRTLISTGHLTCQDPEGEGTGGQAPPPPPPTPKRSQSYRVSYQNCSESNENHKAIKPKFNVWPSWARLRNAIKMVFHWRADDGQLLEVFGSSLHSSTTNICQHSDQTLWIRACLTFTKYDTVIKRQVPSLVEGGTGSILIG